MPICWHPTLEMIKVFKSQKSNLECYISYIKYSKVKVEKDIYKRFDSMMPKQNCNDDLTFMINILTDLKDASVTLSGEKYFTSSLIYLIMSNLINNINNLTLFPNSNYSTIASEFLSMLQSEFDFNNIYYKCAAFVDLRFKKNLKFMNVDEKTLFIDIMTERYNLSRKDQISDSIN